MNNELKAEIQSLIAELEEKSLIHDDMAGEKASGDISLTINAYHKGLADGAHSARLWVVSKLGKYLDEI